MQIWLESPTAISPSGKMQNTLLQNIYRQTFNIQRTESHNLNISRPVMELPLPNPLKPGVKSKMKT